LAWQEKEKNDIIKRTPEHRLGALRTARKRETKRKNETREEEENYQKRSSRGDGQIQASLKMATTIDIGQFNVWVSTGNPFSLI